LDSKYSSWATEDLATNESLDAIICGLNLNSKNSVLAICGSGDQAFAILEKTDNVCVVDMRERQIEYFLYRKKLIENGEFEEFLNIFEEKLDKDDRNFISSRNRYFSAERLKRIQSNLRNNIKMSKVRVENICDGEFDRIYLSNSFSYTSCFDSPQVERELRKITNLLKKRGLIYLSDFGEIFDEVYFPKREKFFKNLNLRIDRKLTQKAQEFQSKGWNYWKPGILQKI
jgi:SAM-dependent methyltransferase